MNELAKEKELENEWKVKEHAQAAEIARVVAKTPEKDRLVVEKEVQERYKEIAKKIIYSKE